MRGLSSEIELGINTVIEALNYDISLDRLVRNFDEFQEYIGYNASINFKDGTKKSGEIAEAGDDYVLIRYTYKDGKGERVNTDKKILHDSIRDIRVFEKNSDILEADKMKSIIDSKVSSFKMAKDMLSKWVNSPNAPGQDKLKDYIERLVEAGDKGVKFLREALAYTIDYDTLDTHKIASAVKAKPIIYDGIVSLDSSIIELRNQLEADDFNLSEKEFDIGYPERYAKGEFFPKSNYYKDWYNLKEDAVKICPFSTEGEIIELFDLKIQLPKKPAKKDILFSDLPKEEQYWRRPEIPTNITPDNVEAFDGFIKEEYRRRREGIWFMNNGEAVYMPGVMYYAMTYGKMKDNGGYMDFRYAQLKMFYHLMACIVDSRCLGQIFLKSRRTGFTYV
jgi:hypothetical protein